MANQNDSKYINGLFITKKEGQYGEYLSFGLTIDGLKALANLEKNEKGVRNFIASPQKNDPNKYSAKPSVSKSPADKSGDDPQMPF